jgi:hypothetical protein
MRSALNTTLVRGRHRLGNPGLVSVTALVAVPKVSFFSRLFRRGRHRAVTGLAPVTALPLAPQPTRSTELPAAA